MSSKLPSETLVPRGLNGLVDTYPDLNYGLGVLEKRHLIDSGEQTAQIPDGLQKESDLLLGDLSGFMGEESNSDLLFMDIEPDPEIQSLPEFQEPVAELEAAWAERDHTPLYAEHQKELIAPVQSVSPEISEELLEETLYKAARAYANGLSQKEIDRLVKASLGGMTDMLQEELEWLKGQRGLNGNVYVLASAYPNLHNGQWKEEVRKLAQRARYLIVDTDTVMGRKLASQDRFMGMQIVEEVGWKEAFNHYAPKLKSLGCRLASEGSYEQRIQQGFLNIPKRKANLGTRPQDFRPTDHITLKEAQQEFSQLIPQERRVYVREASENRIRLKQATKKVIQSYRAGFISKSELKEIVATGDHRKMLQMLSSKKKLSSESSEYTAPIIGRHQDTRREASVDVRESRIQKKQAERHRKTVAQKVQKVAKAIKSGLRGSSLAKMLRANFSKEDLVLASPLLNPLLKETNALNETVKEAREYSGTPEFRHQSVRKTAQPKKISKQQQALRKISLWTRRQMTEGTCGEVLTGLLKAKFAPSFLKSAQETILDVRQAHEGLSGFVYVDAEAYASPTGTNGCEEGALRHRANQLKFVKKMARCGGCSFANTLADGTSVCQKYNKRLAAETPVEFPQEYQQEMIRLSNASDAEQTASLFGSTYTNDFGLQNTALDGFGFNETASVEQLSGLFFGGMDIGEDE
jgi:hypothetical protein